jgi:hypothetical protein
MSRNPMKISVELGKEKMSESEVREAIEKSARTARNIEAQKGNGNMSHEQARREMIKNAEQDNKEGKI